MKVPKEILDDVFKGLMEDLLPDPPPQPKPKPKLKLFSEAELSLETQRERLAEQQKRLHEKELRALRSPPMAETVATIREMLTNFAPNYASSVLAGLKTEADAQAWISTTQNGRRRMARRRQNARTFGTSCLLPPSAEDCRQLAFQKAVDASQDRADAEALHRKRIDEFNLGLYGPTY